MELIWTETPGERGKEAEQRDSRGSRGGRSAGGTKIYTRETQNSQTGGHYLGWVELTKGTKASKNSACG